MNQLQLAKRTQIINLLIEGNSLRATSRIADVSINTVTKLLVEVGRACEEFHSVTVRNLKCQQIQADKVWSFIYAKANESKRESCDIWTWTALALDSRFIVSWLVSDRSQHGASVLIKDVAERISTERIQILTDGNSRHSPVVYTSGTETEHPSTEASPPHVEREDLIIHDRRFTEFANGFSKKIDNHMCAIALHFVYYNFVKVHNALRVTPAMEVGLTKKPMMIEEIIELTNTIKSN